MPLSDHARPRVRPEERVIYEAHLKGLTQGYPGMSAERRGRFAGLAEPSLIEHMKRLGVTSLELLPVQAFTHDRVLIDRGLKNYWGYQPLSYFAPHTEYLSEGARHLSAPYEVQSAFRQLHSAGLEVLLDVVYNHTCEGNHLGPTLSFRGLDNASYYRLHPEQPRYYLDDSGCGNSLRVGHPRVIQLVTDSLRYWVHELGADGFRFDLASSLGRGDGHVDLYRGLFFAIAQDPLLSRVCLIAEPWDVGPNGYQLGGFPPRWLEWNDRFRDTLRGYWRGDPGLRPRLAESMSGSAELFQTRGRLPSCSVNYVCSHDGFTLHDLVRYEHKHNEANGEGNRDGHAHNLSVNYGLEGESGDPELEAHRTRHQRALLATLFLSRGTKMLLAGDEFGRTQAGNNNAYCQDTPLGWVSWEGIAERDQGLLHFTEHLAELRRRLSLLRSDEWLTGASQMTEYKDVTWLTPQGEELQEWEPQGHPHALPLCFALAHTEGLLWVGMNPCEGSLACQLSLSTLSPRPPLTAEKRSPSLEASQVGWRRVIDSARLTQPSLKRLLSPQSHSPQSHSPQSHSPLSGEDLQEGERLSVTLAPKSVQAWLLLWP
jgi:glycogen operon protein